MSMSIRDDGTGLEWAGALGRKGIFPTRDNLTRPAYLRMLTEVPRFHRRARRLLQVPGDDHTLREFLAEGGFTPYFTRHFMEPLVAAVWSSDPDRDFERLLARHGFDNRTLAVPAYPGCRKMHYLFVARMGEQDNGRRDKMAHRAAQRDGKPAKRHRR